MDNRGAYTARKLAELIVRHRHYYNNIFRNDFWQDCIGLLTTENLGLFFNIWKDISDDVSTVIPSGTRMARIRCIYVSVLVPADSD